MKRPLAICLARAGDDIFARGLKAVGYQLIDTVPATICPDDIVLAWNRRPCDEVLLRRFEKAGANVIIAENGYAGHDAAGKKLIALALGHHCGLGKWVCGDEPRWPRQHIALEPWRETGDAVVALLQRGIGEPGVAMPKEWPGLIERELKKITSRPIKMIAHPGKLPVHEIEALTAEAIRNAWAVVTWGSSRAIRALAAGVPVFHLLPGWIGAGMSKFGIKDIENPLRPNRVPDLHRIGWAQWSEAEIITGMPFKILCQNIG